MDMNIVESVYNYLESSTDEIGKIVAERDAVDAKMKSGRYSVDTVNKELFPKWGELRHAVDRASENAIQTARDMIEQYRQEVAKLNNLDPAELTDDVRLFQSGISLMPRDIQGILERNAGNRTMTQIALRYAKEHGIDIGRTYYIGGQQEEETAHGLDDILTYYAKWIDKPSAKKMLARFFQR